MSRIFVLWLTLLSVAHADPESSWKFQVLRTEHFEIIYDVRQPVLAKQYAVAAERAYELLFPIFKEAPYKTIVVLTDETDLSNGLATFLPYPSIYVYPVLPSVLDSNDDYGDWPLEMLVHEYTHILNMYSSHGIYTPLRWLFGSVVRPNAILPKWYLEGLAVTTESRFTDHGRLRSVGTSADARAWHLGGKVEKAGIADINEQDIPSWPYGSRPYLFGGWWWNEVIKSKGYPVMETWNQNFSRRLPFLLNGPMREQMGKSASEIWQSARTVVSEQAARELASIDASNPHVSTPVLANSGEQFVFGLSPSGQKLIYWISRPKAHGSQAWLKTRAEAGQAFSAIKEQKLFKTTGTTKVTWLSESKIVFDQVDKNRPNVEFRDLYLYDFDSGDTTRLTKYARAQGPASSPKGDRVVYVQNEGGRNHLMMIDVASKQKRLLIKGSYVLRISGPEFIDDSKVIFSLRKRSGEETLQTYDLKAHKIAAFNQDLKSAQNIRRTSLGLIATDARTRVRNAYLVGVGANPSQAISNTRTDIETIDFDRQRNELLFSELTPEGRRLMSTPFERRKPAMVETAKIEPAPTPSASKIKMQNESYVPIYYLWPRYWIPMVYPTENGVLVQGTSAVNDPVGRNQYSIFGSYDTVTQKPSYGIDYANRSFPSEIGLGYSKTVRYLTADELTLENQAAAVTITNRWPFNSRYATWSFGGLSIDTAGAYDDYVRQGPTFGFKYSKLQSSSWFGFHLEGHHEEFIVSGENLAYGRSRANMAESISLGRGHRIFLQTRAAVAPKLPLGNQDLPAGTVGRAIGTILDLGETTVGGNYLVSLSNSDNLMRGYPSGTFVGRKLINSNLEYSFPLADTIGGTGTFPMYFNDLEMAFFGDAVAVDGAAYDVDIENWRRAHLRQIFTGAGTELRFNTTAAYHLPVTLIVGAYYGFQTQYGGGFSTFLGIGMGSLGGLQDKTP
jgi:hypothetical protein